MELETCPACGSLPCDQANAPTNTVLALRGARDLIFGMESDVDPDVQEAASITMGLIASIIGPWEQPNA